MIREYPLFMEGNVNLEIILKVVSNFSINTNHAYKLSVLVP